MQCDLLFRKRFRGGATNGGVGAIIGGGLTRELNVDVLGMSMMINACDEG
jgi:hypothetical protein